MDKDTPGTLEERLRAEIERKRDAGGDMLYRGAPDPLLTEAADEIASLRARVEVLEGALTEIAEARWPDTPEIYPEVKASRGIDRVQAFARQALKDAPDAE